VDFGLLQQLLVLSLLMVIGLTLLGYQVMVLLTPESPPITQRLFSLTQGDDANSFEVDPLLRTLNRRLTPFIELCRQWGSSFYGTTPKLKKQTATLLQLAGKPCDDKAIEHFLGWRIAAAIICSVVFGLALLPMKQPLFIVTGLIGGFYLGGLLVYMGLKRQAAERIDTLRRALPDTLDLMVVCMEAGLGLDATIKRVSQETQHLSPTLANELNRVSLELNAGLPRDEVLKQLGNRNGVDELRSLCTTMIQSDRLGTSISSAMRIYAEDIRQRRKQMAEELAAKASIKMTLPLVLFVFPPLMIILLGPVVITALDMFSGG
jgi:tight adherence protein C